MSHPEWVLEHKKPNTQICFIKGKYYLYGRTSVWCPVKKRAKKVTTACVGRIDPEHGLIPTGTIPRGRHKRRPAEPAFMDDIAQIPDLRKDQGKRFSFAEIFLCALLATLCGADGWQDIEHYAKANLDFLRCFFPFTHGAPSDDTIRRLFCVLCPKAFKEVFQNWVRALAVSFDLQVIAIDGKCARRSYDGIDKSMLHHVHAYAVHSRLVVGQEKVADKSNEITAIPKLLDVIDIKGQIVTIDAMGCQFSIADLILSKGGDFIFSLKGNQGTLNDDVRLYFEAPPESETFHIHGEPDKGHGRLEERVCTLSTNVAWLHERHPQWNSIKSLIKIQNTCEKKGKTTQETRYYISSLDKEAPFMAQAIRDHWGVEAFHWVLDMSFNEDYLRIRKGNSAETMAILRHFAFNMLQSFLKAEDNSRLSLKGLRKICGWDKNTLKNVIAGTSS